MRRRLGAINPGIVEGTGVHHILNKWHEATDDERNQGMRWYADAHLVATSLAHGDAAKGAGIVANYSPQSAWPQNLHNAARVLHENTARGGPGDGMLASAKQRASAQRILDGEHHSKVFKTQKIGAFAHLIEHAGQDENDHSKPSDHVCIDRHALSVAVGRRLSDKEFEDSGVSTKGRYKQVADHYREAAKTLSEEHGHQIAPHQVQAVTWITQQRQNQAEDEARSNGGEGAAKGRKRSWDSAMEKWQDHVDEHHPNLKGQAPTAYASLHSTAGRTQGDRPGDEFQDGQRLRQYNESGKSGFISGSRVMCDACASAAGKSPQYAAQHWARPSDNCEHPDHDFNVLSSGVEEPNEYEHHKDNPQVMGWAKDDFTTHGSDTTLCPACAEDRRTSGHDMGDYYAIPKSQLMPEDRCDDCGHDLHAGRKEAILKTQAYGETRAPQQVDTLRDDQCPVCGDADTYDGDQCQVCGFVSPPKMFQDPDLQRARLLDLRADPATGDPNDTNPNVGQNLPPVDPSAVDAEGDIAGDDIEGQEAGQDTDQDGIVEGEVRSLGDEGAGDEPVAPGEVDENGNIIPDVDPEAATSRVMQGGEPFTPGPNAPTPQEPMEPAATLEDEEEGNSDEEADDGQMDAAPQGDPGDPGDTIPDLFCPSCGYSADAAHPTSTPGSAVAPANAGDGELEGDICPQCQQATLMGIGQMEQMEQGQV